MSGIKYQMDMQGWVSYHWIVKLLLLLNSLLISGQYGSPRNNEQFCWNMPDTGIHTVLWPIPFSCWPMSALPTSEQTQWLGSRFQQWHNLQYWGRQLAPGYWPYTFASSWILVLLMRAWWYSFDLSFALPRRVLAISTIEHVKLYSYSTDALQIPAWQYLNDR